MANNVQRRLREKNEMRLKILDAARDLFTTGGEEAVTLRKVAEKIEYSATTIYLHFADKEALLRELCTADFLVFSRTLKQAERIGDPVERLRQMASAYVDFGLQYPGYYRLMFLPSGTNPPSQPPEETLPSPPGHTQRTPATNGDSPGQGAQDFLYRAVFKAMAAGCFKPELLDVAALTQTFWSGLHGVVSLHLVRAKYPAVAWRPINTAKDLMIDCLINGLTTRHGS